MKGEKSMKKTVLALLILSALLMLFSCSSDKVEPPTPTRPDLDLPIPGLTEDIGFYPYPPDSSHWQHDPDPFDEIRIYGGLSGKDFARVAIERGSCTLTVQVCHTVSQSELRALGIKYESNIIVNTTYTVSNLKVSPSISSDPNEKMLSSDEYSIVAYQEVTSPDGRK